MSDKTRAELDVLVERALQDWAADATPPDRVWRNIRLGLRERSRRDSSKYGRVRTWCTEALSCGVDLVVSARMILTPSLSGGENGWTRRLVLAGQSSALYYLSIQH
ncbi:MAG TPA: hypothetical protein VM075_09825 [Anaerolineae bacterium]|nr:hypothetical protein [Anaerolineae bacterium]